MNHLDEMASPVRPDVSCTWAVLRFGRDCFPNRTNLFIGLGGTSRHQARPVTRALFATRYARTDKTEALLLKCCFTANRVGKLGIAAINNNIAGFEKWLELFNRPVDRWPGLDHHHDLARALETFDKVLG